MVRDRVLAGQFVQVCEVCLLAYDKPGLAQQCETHCKTHPSCSLAIGRQAVGSWQEESA
jgi:hypothetical protein